MFIFRVSPATAACAGVVLWACGALLWACGVLLAIVAPIASAAQELGRQDAPSLESSLEQPLAPAPKQVLALEIIVTANRAAQNLSQVGQSVAVISAQDIATRQYITVSDALRTISGVTVTRSGPLGALTSVNIRGAAGAQTLLLIDNVKLTDPSAPSGGFDFGSLLTDSVERIEVVRGAQSALWGSQAIGGVVNYITRVPTSVPQFDVLGEYGWRDTVRLAGNFHGTWGPLAASIGGGYLRSDGFSAYSEARGGGERDGYRQYGVHGKFTLKLSPSIALDLRGYYSDGIVGIDGFPPPSFIFGDSQETSQNKNFVGYAGLHTQMFDGRWRQRLAYAHTRVDRDNLDLSGAVSRVVFDGLGRSNRFDYQSVFDFGGDTKGNPQAQLLSGQWLAGAEYEISSYRQSSFGAAFSLAEARIFSLYSHLSLSLVDRLTIGGGVRYDHHNRYGTSPSFTASMSYSPNEGVSRLRASYGTGFKAPSLYQLFSDFGYPALRPERAQSFDIGLSQSLFGRAVLIEATYFYRRARDEIDFVTCSGDAGAASRCNNRPFGSYDNITRTRAQGVEVGLRLQPNKSGLSAQLSYSWIAAINRANSLRLARRPTHSVNLALDYDLSRNFAVGATLSYVGDSFDDPANQQRVAGYAVVDLRAQYALGERVEIYGRIENLFDKAYESIFQYGTARRSVYMGLRLKLGVTSGSE